MRVRWSWLISIGVHLAVLFAGGALFLNQAQFGVEIGEGGIPGEVAVEMETEPPREIEPPVEIPPQEAEIIDRVVPQPKPQIRPKPASSGGSGGARLDAKPNYLRNPPPAYPAESKRRGEQGVVFLQVEVSTEGKADVVEVIRSSGFSRLDVAAVEAVRRWKFHPARWGELAVASRAQVPIRFQLE